MTFQILGEIQKDKVEMRNAYVESLIETAKRNDNVVALDADLMRAMNIFPFREAFPARMVDCGVMEANMFSVAGGLSSVGKIPFAHTFAVFCTRRACDQIFVSCAYSGQNVKVIGSDPGVTAQINGGTHMPFEDMGIMRTIPGMTIIEPTDTSMIRDMVKQLAEINGMFYIRLVRKNVEKIYTDGSTFTIGKANLLADGNDVTVFAAGLLVVEALKAAAELKKKNINARIYDMFTIKPIDKEAILKAARETGAIVTAENHSIYNGLGSAIAEIIVEGHPVPMQRIGVRDQFGEVGSLEYLKERFCLTAKDIYNACEDVIARKRA